MTGLVSIAGVACAVTGDPPPAEPTGLAFVAQPVVAEVGTALIPAPVVELRDDQGVVVAREGVAIVLRRGQGQGILQGTRTQPTDASGRATFPGLSLDQEATGVTLIASSAGLGDEESAPFTVVATGTAPTHVAYEVQPSDVEVGQVVAPAPVVVLLDANEDPTALAGITVTLTRGQGNGSLQGVTAVATDATGRATFGSVTLDTEGSGVTIIASASGLAPEESAPFDVLPSTVITQLAFLVQPSDAGVGETIDPAPVVEVRNAAGQAVPTGGVPITLTRLQGSGTLSGPTTVATNAAGRAAFPGLSVSVASPIVTLAAAAPGVPSAESDPFAVTAPPPPATQLAFVVQPGNTQVNQPIAPAPVVALRDAAGQPVPMSGVSITVTRMQGSGTLSGPTTVATDGAGRAAFPGLSLNTASPVVTLAAAAAGLTSAESSPFAVTTPPPPGTQLAFLVQPGASQVGQPIVPNPVVEVRDAAGQPVPMSGVAVAIALGEGSGTLSGTSPVATNGAGRATFTDLTLSTAQAGATLVATSSGLASAESAPFTVSAGGGAFVENWAPAANTNIDVYPTPGSPRYAYSSAAYSGNALFVNAAANRVQATIGRGDAHARCIDPACPQRSYRIATRMTHTSNGLTELYLKMAPSGDNGVFLELSGGAANIRRLVNSSPSGNLASGFGGLNDGFHDVTVDVQILLVSNRVRYTVNVDNGTATVSWEEGTGSFPLVGTFGVGAFAPGGASLIAIGPLTVTPLADLNQ